MIRYITLLLALAAFAAAPAARANAVVTSTDAIMQTWGYLDAQPEIAALTDTPTAVFTLRQMQRVNLTLSYLFRATPAFSLYLLGRAEAFGVAADQIEGL